MTQINKKATEYLKKLKRIQKIPDDTVSLEQTLLLFPEGVDLYYTDDDVIITDGLGETLDAKHNDLSTVIGIRDPLNLDYIETNILMPRVYAKTLKPVPNHISVQAVVLSQVTEQGKDEVLEMIDCVDYNKTPYDRIWIEDNDPKEKLCEGEIIIVMNRRVGGWDGSRARPVIELLGGGGHLPTIWNDKLQRFQQMDPVDAVIKEFDEELKYSLSSSEVDIVGGFHNRVSNELVILCIVFVPFPKIVTLQNGALGNFKESVDGIYLGRFKKTMQLYLENAEPYAGGEKTKDSNFPSQPELMQRISQKLNM